jgi:hypothetical protein
VGVVLDPWPAGGKITSEALRMKLRREVDAIER